MSQHTAPHMRTEAASPATEHVSEPDQQTLKRPPQSIGYGLLWAFFLFVIGLVPRLSHLTYHSLWLDEAISIGWARLPARLIVSTGLELVQDKHPPLYYLVLHYWTRLFGEGEVSVRLLSALIGALAIPLGYLLMRELYGHRAGVAAALLLAFNPFLIWYSQEVRMFGLATTLLLEALIVLGYVKKQDSRYANTAMTVKWVLRSSPNSVAGVFGHAEDVLEIWGNGARQIYSLNTVRGARSIEGRTLANWCRYVYYCTTIG